MTAPKNPRPDELGEALTRVREERGVTLEAIADRTKISRRQLEALESGDYSKLPGRAFARMFLRQHLEIVGEDPEGWLPSFEQAWRRYTDASAPFPVVQVVPAPRRRLWPWVVAVLVVVSGFGAVVLLSRGGGEGAAVLASSVITPVPPVPTAVATPQPTPVPPREDVLLVRATDRPCWAEVSAPGRPASSRLLAPGEAWEVELPPEGVDVKLGDAGAVELQIGGQTLPTPGGPGEVVRLHLPEQPPG